ncbi:hypothetical protein F2Q69_00042932 [Brassica cretica]|uniref:Uncharacterized protein n=1 Tax=Brassica cretica TaxID=69181 RepID=A0A8S9NN19_BRACR|nr:hypothetical protein F2Q69_00042932 [Brassica cretica]
MNIMDLEGRAKNDQHQHRNTDRQYDLNVDQRHDLNIDRRYNVGIDPHTIPSSIDGDSCLRTRPLEIPENSIDLHPHSIIVRHPTDCIDRHPLLDEPHSYIVKLEQVEERVHESEASDNVDSKHLRPLICAEEAIGFHKRVKRIHDPVKIVVPCAVFEVEFPIPPDNGSHLSSYIEEIQSTQQMLLTAICKASSTPYC